MNAVDTNVLMYVHDPRAPQKQARAAELVRDLRDGVLLWHVACEYLAASRKLEPFGFSRADAIADLVDLRRLWTPALPVWSVIDRATDLMGRYSLAYWDAMIVAASLAAGVGELFSEDFGPYPEIDGLRMTNPFSAAGGSA